MTAFAFDNISSSAVFGGLSRRRQRADTTNDIYLELSTDRRTHEKLVGERWDEQPDRWHEEVLPRPTGDKG
jgi:hypothetical protein